MKNLDGDLDSIIANDNVFEAGTPVTVRILPTDKGFKSHGCGMWKKTA
jgi:hypothetical protein